jgi:putative transposase
MEPKPNYRKLCKRYDVPGESHFLTFSCFQRMPLLSKERAQVWMIDALEAGCKGKQFDLWAYVIMPEHVHMVILPLNGTSISTILSSLKQPVAKRAIHWLRQNSPEFLGSLVDTQPSGKTTHRFWQRGGGYDRNLRSVSDIYEKIEYTHHNPVRRGLVSKPEDWHWSSARAWKTGEDVPMAVSRSTVPTLVVGGDWKCE